MNTPIPTIFLRILGIQPQSLDFGNSILVETYQFGNLGVFEPLSQILQCLLVLRFRKEIKCSFSRSCFPTKIFPPQLGNMDSFLLSFFPPPSFPFLTQHSNSSPPPRSFSLIPLLILLLLYLLFPSLPLSISLFSALSVQST